ncbi:MAG: type II toxin-antitoxin system RelE/ParE family toxin [Coriobacteriia bacterium]|nr:type II toxin-antitoxin system RelE/ParE family toxin [Coriobacteriia bacterium]
MKAAKVIYSEPAVRDLERIRDFFYAGGIERALTKKYIATILSDIIYLADQPELGFPMGEKYDFKTPYLGFIVWDGRYLAVYELVYSEVRIMRIYSTRENYIKDLLPTPA